MALSRLAGTPALVALLILATFIPSCDNCDNCCIGFTSATPPAPGAVACVKGEEATCELLAIDLIITDVDDIFLAEFTLVFDPAIATYEGMSAEGTILESDGTQLTMIENPQPGEVTILISRLGAAFGGIDAEGEQFLARLYFSKAAAGGSSTMFFSSARLFGLRDGQFFPEIIPGVEWSGGTLSIR
jgi:hypothetical protein